VLGVSTLVGPLAGIRCLYISYNGLSTPLVQSQVLPYLRELTRRGARFVLLTFEQARPVASDIARLRQDGIAWHHLAYHRSPTLPATAFDITLGAAYGALLAKKYRLHLIHARGYPPAMMARVLQLTRKMPFVFDMRGLMADEYVDAGSWSRRSVAYRVTKRAERHLLDYADWVVVLTNRVRPILWPTGEPGRVTTIPCCVDPRLFGTDRDETLAADLGLLGKRVLVYAGSVGTWYLLDSMLRFAAFVHARDKRSHLLLLNQGEHAFITQRLTALGLDPASVTVAAVSPAEMPRHLGLAEAGLCFVMPSYSKQASSPTKVAEYLAAGLPVVAVAGVGDLDELITGRRVGVLLQSDADDQFRSAADALDRLLADPTTSARCRSVASCELSLERGVSAYADVYQRVMRA
jgi:glycosyltransferase involved in cell wall biosynthesis